MVDRRCLLITSLMIACLTPVIAKAASFDCSKAKTRFEQTVCADTVLSSQDAAMAKRYEAALPLLSEPGKTILRTSQKQWLHIANVLCIDSKRDESPAACLRRQYAERLDDLSSAAVSIGPFMFSRYDQYTSNGRETGTGKPFEHHTGLPRIDHPLSPLAEQWNAAIVQSVAAERASWCFADATTPGDEFVNFKIRSATPDFINMTLSHAQVCDGQAGSEDISNISYLLTPTLHRLEAADLFRPGSGWETFLGSTAFRKLSADDAIASADGINADVRDPTAWSFTKQGLLISFNPGDAMASASGIVDVTVPWTNLQRFLAPGAPVPR